MKILVIGGYGNFGRKIVNSLLNYPNFQIVVAGRSQLRATMLQNQILEQKHILVDTAKLDVLEDNLEQHLSKYQPTVVINASGPYHLQESAEKNYSVARACLAIGSHYIDLADNREFVVNFERELDVKAKQKKLALITGASTVPGLTCAVVDTCIDEFSQLDKIDYGISPGNKTDRGYATVKSILSYTGKPFSTLIDGKIKNRYGWQNIRRINFGKAIGKRWMANCNISDLTLLPARYPDLHSVRFQAGLEVTLMHVGLWLLSWLSRWRLISNWSRYTDQIVYLSHLFRNSGSDTGGMYIKLSGKNTQGEPHKVNWRLVATDGSGPNVPTIASEILVNKIALGEFTPGAKPCMGLFSLDEFFNIAKRWNIYQERDTDE